MPEAAPAEAPLEPAIGVAATGLEAEAADAPALEAAVPEAEEAAALPVPCSTSKSSDSASKPV